MSSENVVATRTKQPRRRSLIERAAERVNLQKGENPYPDGDGQPLGSEPVTQFKAETKAATGTPTANVPTAILDQDLCERIKICSMAEGRSVLAEEFRFIKRSVLQVCATLRSQRHPRANVVLVTSTEPNEGKTFTAVNLALSIAQEQDIGAILVDADFGHSEASDLFSSRHEIGLTELLSDLSLDTNDVIRRTDSGSLSFIPSGHPNSNTSELVAGKRMKQVISSLTQDHPDRILIVDAPPTLAMSEASILANYAGQVLFVVEADRTSKLAAKRAVGLLNGCPHVALVLNKVNDPFGTASYAKSYRSS